MTTYISKASSSSYRYKNYKFIQIVLYGRKKTANMVCVSNVINRGRKKIYGIACLILLGDQSIFFLENVHMSIYFYHKYILHICTSYENYVNKMIYLSSICFFVSFFFFGYFDCNRKCRNIARFKMG